jgi:hypothetical protein
MTAPVQVTFYISRSIRPSRQAALQIRILQIHTQLLTPLPIIDPPRLLDERQHCRRQLLSRLAHADRRRAWQAERVGDAIEIVAHGGGLRALFSMEGEWATARVVDQALFYCPYSRNTRLMLLYLLPCRLMTPSFFDSGRLNPEKCLVVFGERALYTFHTP